MIGKRNNTNMDKFPYVVVAIVCVWVILATAYLIQKWRQKGKNSYIIPRVFVLCSPRTVQFHYELIVRVGLPSPDFNPEKHDVDVTVLGQQKNEVIPMTRLNTKTLLDEPLITSLSIIAYRLVEMPVLGGLVLKHSGPFKSWIYAYDFTVIDLSTNREYYYTINQYIGSLNKTINLDEPNKDQDVHYPIDDVPLPQWSLEDVFLILFAVMNFIMLSFGMMPIACRWVDDIICIVLAAIGGGSVVFCFSWFLYYYLRWNRDRKEYFNQYDTSGLFSTENLLRFGVTLISGAIGLGSLYLGSQIHDWKHALIWLLTTINSTTLVIGIWNIARQFEAGEGIVGLGLRLRGIETVGTGMRYSDLISEQRSTSASDEGGSTISTASKRGTKSFGPRSSVKSLGFDLNKAGTPLSSLAGGGRGRSRIMSRVPTSSVISSSPLIQSSIVNSSGVSAASINPKDLASNATITVTPPSEKSREKSKERSRDKSSSSKRKRLQQQSKLHHSSDPAPGHSK